MRHSARQKLVPYLNDSWASGNSVITDGGVAACKHNVALASNGCSALRGFWHLDREPSVDGGCSADEVSPNITRDARDQETYSENTGPVTVMKAA